MTLQSATQSYKREQVVDIINSVIGRLQGSTEVLHDVLSKEMHALKFILDNLHQELSAARPQDISSTHIPTASDELDAIVGATEQATVTIMDSCEKILATVKESAPPATAAAVEDAVVKIFEACTFQDITGQRIRKVTNSLKQIDSKIKSVLATMEGQFGHMEPSAPANNDAPQETSLLNGPALPAQGGLLQDDIDRLLAEFDNKGKS